MILGETKDVRHVIRAASAFSLTAPSVTIFDAAGAVADTGTPAHIGDASAEHTLSWPFTPANAGVFYAVFSGTVGDEERRFEQRIVVEAAPSGAPTATDLAARIRALGTLDPDTEDATLEAFRLEGAVGAALRAFESATGYTPFVAPAAPVTRYYDPPGNGVLFLGGWVEITSVASAYDPSDLSALQALTLHDDYEPAPFGARDEGRPYERVEFRGPQFGRTRSIRVIGRPGYWDPLADGAIFPEDVFEALLDKALLLRQTHLSLAISGGAYSVRTLNTEVRFGGGGVGPLSIEAVAWEKNWAETVAGYRMLVC